MTILALLLACSIAFATAAVMAADSKEDFATIVPETYGATTMSKRISAPERSGMSSPTTQCQGSWAHAMVGIAQSGVDPLMKAWKKMISMLDSLQDRLQEIRRKERAHHLRRWALVGAAVLAAAFAITFISTEVTTMTASSSMLAGTVPLPAYNADVHTREEIPCKLDLGDEVEQGYIIWVWGEIAGTQVQVHQVVDSDRIPLAGELVSGIEADNVDGLDVNVPSCGTVVTMDGVEYRSPSARVARTVGQKIDDNRAILLSAFDAMLYRQSEGSRLVIGRENGKGTHKASFESDEGQFELRREHGAMTNHQPVLRKIEQELGIEIEKISIHDSMSWMRDTKKNVVLTKLLVEAGLSVVGVKDDAMFVVDSADDAAEIFQLLGCAAQLDQPKYSLVHTPEVLNRVGALLGRKGLVEIGYEHRGSVAPEEMDGQKAVLESVPGIFQGTGLVMAGGTLKLAKGIIRPPVRFRGTNEDESFEQELQFGKTAERGEGVSFRAFDRATEETSSLNQQIVGFTAEDEGAGWYDSLKQNLAQGVEAVMSETEKLWMELGFDSADVLPDRSLRKFARKSDIEGYRGMVIGVGKSDGEWILNEGEVLLPASIMERLDLERGDVVRIARDPGQADGKSIREFVVAGELRFVVDGDVQKADNGIAISAESDMWLDMGGDFDGDGAVVWAKGSADVGELSDGVESHSPRKAPHSDPLFRSLTEETLRSAVNQAREQSWSIGIEVNKARRLWLLGDLDAEIRSTVQALSQGAIDAKKHLVSSKMMSEMQDIVEERLEDFEVNGEIDLIGMLSTMKRGEQEFDATYCKVEGELRLKVEQGVNIKDGMLITSDDGEQTVRVIEQDGQYVEIEHVSGDEKPKTEFHTDVWARMLEVAENVIDSDETSEAAKSFAGYLTELYSVREEHLDAREGEGEGLPQELAKRLRFALAQRTSDGDSIDQEDEAEELHNNWAKHCYAAQDAESEQEAAFHDAMADRKMDRARALASRGEMSPGALMSVDNISTFFLTRVLDPRDVEDYLDVSDDEQAEEGTALF